METGTLNIDHFHPRDPENLKHFERIFFKPASIANTGTPS
jgi:hypothetical protein